MIICCRLGLNVKNDVVLSLWSEVLKNKDGSIHPHELVRHFTKRYQKRPTGVYSKSHTVICVHVITNTLSLVL